MDRERYYLNKMKALEKASPEDYIVGTILGENIESGGTIVWQRIDESSRILQWISKNVSSEYVEKAPWGIISAWRPEKNPQTGEGERTRKENRQATRELVADLRKNGFGVIPMKGLEKDDEGNIVNWEVSFFVPGVKTIGGNKIPVDYKDFVKLLSKLAKKFNQDAFIVYNPEEDIIELWSKNNEGDYRRETTFNYASFTPDRFIGAFSSVFKRKAFQFQTLKDLKSPEAISKFGKPLTPDKRLIFGKDKEQTSESKQTETKFILYEGQLRRLYTWMAGMASKPEVIVYNEFLDPFILAKYRNL